MDRLDARQRSENMRRIPSKNTQPEILLRSMLHQRGYRFRLHRKSLPGSPDIVFPGRHKAVFLHGCFWHQHRGCREGRIPGSRQDYWLPKLQRNKWRDASAIRALHKLGWDVFVVWECELRKSVERTLARLASFIEREI